MTDEEYDAIVAGLEAAERERNPTGWKPVDLKPWIDAHNIPGYTEKSAERMEWSR